MPCCVAGWTGLIGIVGQAVSAVPTRSAGRRPAIPVGVRVTVTPYLRDREAMLLAGRDRRG